MEDDVLPPHARDLVAGAPDTPLDAPRERRRCIIEEVWDESRAYIGLRVGVDDDFKQRYRRPGQYVTLSPEQFEPRFLVIASGPGVDSKDGWEFLVDRHTDLGRSIDPLKTGATLEISAPEGPGYPADDVAGKTVLCFTTGSGIASIRPALQYWRRAPEKAPADIAIYYGESHPGDFAYTGESDEWSRQGVRTFLCNGALAEGGSGFRYVQNAFDADAPDIDDAVVFLSGASIMKRAVIRRLVDLGLPVDQIVTNV